MPDSYQNSEKKRTGRSYKTNLVSGADVAVSAHAINRCVFGSPPKKCENEMLRKYELFKMAQSTPRTSPYSFSSSTQLSELIKIKTLIS